MADTRHLEPVPTLEEAEPGELDAQAGRAVLEATDAHGDATHPEPQREMDNATPREADEPYRYVKYTLDKRITRLDEMLETTEADLFSVESVVDALADAGADEDNPDNQWQHKRYLEYCGLLDQYNTLRAQADSLKRKRERHINAQNPPSEGIRTEPPAKRRRQRR